MADLNAFKEVMNLVHTDESIGKVADFSDFKENQSPLFDKIKLPVGTSERSKKIYYLPKDTITKISSLAAQQGFQSDSAFLKALIDQFD